MSDNDKITRSILQSSLIETEVFMSLKLAESLSAQIEADQKLADSRKAMFAQIEADQKLADSRKAMFAKMEADQKLSQVVDDFLKKQRHQDVSIPADVLRELKRRQQRLIAHNI